ncbi:flagellar export chaperone FliS [Paenibacillus sp. 481]|uniref:flagellar export chaperone FliS n=1 Tax=Paenibacillus sp. 481 TaxID=2835869 RepID=UPI001E39AA2E|nr:flagellar export chaperone FliS [Paenibacillus sp. 481]UHA75715.1 flagellar export chaperone FliS [Paenibacillus sp. 481]
MQNAKQMQYLKVQVETASPGELTLLLYQEIVKSLLRAKQHYSQHQFEEMNHMIHKVRSIYSELIVTLNMDYPISKDLFQLYMFYQQQLAHFIVKRDELVLEDAIEFSKGMVETWKLALQQLKKVEI